MKAIVIAKPVFLLTLDKEIVSMLMELSASHYDMRCKVASRQGGFLYGWSNCIDMGVDCTATHSNLDTTLKICESTWQLGDEVKTNLMARYAAFIFKILDKSKELTQFNIELGE